MIIKTLTSTFFALIICSIAYATTVYKWDEDGKTIYSQTPPPPGVKFEIVVEKNIGKPTSVATAKSNSTSSTFEQRREQRLQDKTEKEVLEESNRIKQENCTIAQKNMKSLSSHGQVTVKDGELYRKLSEEERQDRVTESQYQIEEFCQG